MKLALPPGMTAAQLDRALKAFAGVVGDQWVLATDLDRDTYLDHFAVDESAHAASAAVAPATAEEVRDIVKLANVHKLPLWPISRGKNFGYGGAAPRLKGSVVLDLSRMKKIEFNEEFGTALVEPGVGFYDLYDYIQQRKLPYWMSVPGNSWGSVVGNALDRGVGYTTYGDHCSKICGMEVVLPTGEFMRTGMGAMSGTENWQLYKYGFGPGWDQMFVQSNFGVVTKMGLWLMPQPESMLSLALELDKPDDLGWAVDLIAPMRRDGLLQQSPSLGSWLRGAAVLTTRREWYDRPGALPDDVIAAIRKRFNIGWWSIDLRLYGYESVNQAAAKIIQAAFAKKTPQPMKVVQWKQGDAMDLTPFSGVPSTFPLQNAAWHGGRGGHIGYSPVLPASGSKALAQFRRTYDRYNEFGMDYHGSFAMGERNITNVNQVLFNKDDKDMMSRVDRMFRALVADASAQRYGEYRTHIDYMDLVAGTYDFNGHALRRVNETVKDALDPNGILAPGKSGIWPSRYRSQRT
ncbi:MAG TPA: FAD-dependent oxidoreductase [Steroidobacteraceae bacterium]|jgi:4-cresol dehydrogenase (hydroxylating)|nr:FAD-dependent oxidoreductase [Steroidobacteraceae bacterium]